MWFRTYSPPCCRQFPVFSEICRVRSADSRERLFVEILNRDPTAPHATSEAVSPTLNEICLRCLRKNIAESYGSAADLVQALNGVSVSKDEVSSGTAGRWVQPKWKPELVAITVAGPLVLLAALSLAWAFGWTSLLLPERAVGPSGVASATEVDNDNLARAPVPFR